MVNVKLKHNKTFFWETMLFTLSLQYNIAITEESAEALARDESGQVNTDLLNEVGTIFVANLREIMDLIGFNF